MDRTLTRSHQCLLGNVPRSQSSLWFFSGWSPRAFWEILTEDTRRRFNLWSRACEGHAPLRWTDGPVGLHNASPLELGPRGTVLRVPDPGTLTCGMVEVFYFWTWCWLMTSANGRGFYTRPTFQEKSPLFCNEMKKQRGRVLTFRIKRCEAQTKCHIGTGSDPAQTGRPEEPGQNQIRPWTRCPSCPWRRSLLSCGRSAVDQTKAPLG